VRRRVIIKMRYAKSPIPKAFSNNEIIVFLILNKLGVRFLTQVPIDIEDKVYFPDFFIFKSHYPQMKPEGIDIEVDSEDFHEKTKGQIRKDEERDEAFEKHGYKVIRINEKELKNTKKVEEKLKKILKELNVL
jgi:very-short-patch-repair endonuclease